MLKTQTKIPDYLVFQAVQCATNYSEWDVKMMLSGMTDEEVRLLNRHLYATPEKKSNDKIVRAIAIIQDLRDMRERRKIEITEINPKGKQKIKVIFYP